MVNGQASHPFSFQRCLEDHSETRDRKGGALNVVALRAAPRCLARLPTSSAWPKRRRRGQSVDLLRRHRSGCRLRQDGGRRLQRLAVGLPGDHPQSGVHRLQPAGRHRDRRRNDARPHDRRQPRQREVRRRRRPRRSDRRRSRSGVRPTSSCPARGTPPSGMARPTASRSAATPSSCGSTPIWRRQRGSTRRSRRRPGTSSPPGRRP